MEMNDLLNKLHEEVGEPSKNLTKEDALAMVSNFVKEIRKKFPSMADRKEILKTALKTLQFYVDEVDGDFDFSGSDKGEFDYDEDEFDDEEDEDDEDDEDDEEDEEDEEEKDIEDDYLERFLR